MEQKKQNKLDVGNALFIYSRFVMSYIQGEEYLSIDNVLKVFNERGDEKITKDVLKEYLNFMYEWTLIGKIEREYKFVGYCLIELR